MKALNVRSSWLSALALCCLLGALPSLAVAQGPRPGATGTEEETPSPLEQLTAQLQHTDDRNVWRAAVTLLQMRASGKVAKDAIDAIGERLRQGSPTTIRNLLNAVAAFPTLPDTHFAHHGLVGELMPVLRPSLSSKDVAIRQEAQRAVIALDEVVPDERGIDAVDALIEVIIAGPKAPALELVSAVAILGRKPPKKAVPVLIRILSTNDTDMVQAACYEQLYAATGHHFNTREQAVSWWNANRNRRPEEWYIDRLRKTEAALKVAQQSAYAWWQVLLQGAAGDQQKLDPLLERSLADPVARIRMEAARELGRLGKKTGAQAVVDQLLREDEPGVMPVLLDTVASLASTDQASRDKATLAVVSVLERHVDRDVRLRAVRCLGALRSPLAGASLQKLLGSSQGDSLMHEAVLEAIAVIADSSNPQLVQAVLEQLDLQMKQSSDSGQAVVSGCLKALKAMARSGAVTATSPYATRVVTTVEAILVAPGQEPRAPSSDKVRQLAAAVFRELKFSGALPILYRALGDKSDDVARFVVDAIGETAAATGTEKGSRLAALQELSLAFQTERLALRQPIVDNFRKITATQPQALELLTSFSVHLREKATDAGGFSLILRLLADLPTVPPAGPERARWIVLRGLLAEAMLRGQEQDTTAAIAVYEELVTLDKTFTEPLADALVAQGLADGLERSISLYHGLLSEGGDGTTLWPKQVRAIDELAGKVSLKRVTPLIEAALLITQPALPEALKARLQKHLEAPSPNPKTDQPPAAQPERPLAPSAESKTP